MLPLGLHSSPFSLMRLTTFVTANVGRDLRHHVGRVTTYLVNEIAREETKPASGLRLIVV
jgi:hypothetical protein